VKKIQEVMPKWEQKGNKKCRCYRDTDGLEILMEALEILQELRSLRKKQLHVEPARI
jgi:hypothetical protein